MKKLLTVAALAALMLSPFCQSPVNAQSPGLEQEQDQDWQSDAPPGHEEEGANNPPSWTEEEPSEPEEPSWTGEEPSEPEEPSWTQEEPSEPEEPSWTGEEPSEPEQPSWTQEEPSEPEAEVGAPGSHHEESDEQGD
jgi:hypothetical protein